MAKLAEKGGVMATSSSTALAGILDRSTLSEIRPGLVVVCALGAVAMFMSRGLGGPLAKSPLLLAILIGLLIGNSFGRPETLRPGLTFTVRQMLRLAVALVGFRITLHELATLGLVPFLLAAIGLSATFVFTTWTARRFFRVEPEMSYLLAAGSSVCGASAVLAVAALVRARPQQTTMAVTLVTLLGTLTLLVYPLAFGAGYRFGLDESSYGIFIGATLYEVAQVVGAGYGVSEMAGNIATVVKLTKVVMLGPLLIILGLWLRRTHTDHSTARWTVPWFLPAFLLVIFLNTLHVIPASVVAIINEIDLFLLTVVMVALGLETRLGRLRELRWAAQATYASLLTLVFTAVMGYTLVRFTLPTLATPLRGGYELTGRSDGTPASTALSGVGERTFLDIGCAKCHTPSLSVGKHRIYLYSDLLLHDMGPSLDDKVVQETADGRDWRTTPLWGLRFRTRFLHDGRATTLRDAIVAHGGEAEIVVERFLDLNEDAKRELYLFLSSL